MVNYLRSLDALWIVDSSSTYHQAVSLGQDQSNESGKGVACEHMTMKVSILTDCG